MGGVEIETGIPPQGAVLYRVPHPPLEVTAGLAGRDQISALTTYRDGPEIP